MRPGRQGSATSFRRPAKCRPLLVAKTRPNAKRPWTRLKNWRRPRRLSSRLASPQKTWPAIRPLMLTMDAIQADAKIALVTGNVEAAKKQAFVLAELARLVSNSRSTEGWSSLAGDFASAATTAATTTETDPKAVRQLFRGV